MSSKKSLSEAERRWFKVLGTLNEFQARLFVAEKALGTGTRRDQPAFEIDRHVPRFRSFQSEKRGVTLPLV